MRRDDSCSKSWLHDYSPYVSGMCGFSWDAAVALYVDAWTDMRGRRGFFQ